MNQDLFTQAQLDTLLQLKYKTPYLQHLLETKSDLSDGFTRHVLSLSFDDAVTFDCIMCEYNGDPSGVEFVSSKRDMWAFVLPDMSSPGKHRIQYFDARGFCSHATFDTTHEAVHTMVREGYCVPDPGALDRLSTTDSWHRGTQVAALLMEHNCGRISYTDFIERCNALA